MKNRGSAAQVDGISNIFVNDILVQRVEPHILDGIDLSSYSFCNTNNHYDIERHDELKKRNGEDEKDENWYQLSLSETKMEKWLIVLGDLLTRKPRHVFTISPSQQRRYFKHATKLARQGVRAKQLFRDEAEELAAELQKSHDDHNGEATSMQPYGDHGGHGWFVRTSSCSPKDAKGDGGAGPHFSLVDVLLALLGSERVHKSMKNYDMPDIKVYLIPFDQAVTIERELRVFVHNNRVTAMSQYDVYNPSRVFSTMEDEQLASVALLVDVFHREQIVPRWTGVHSYVMDIEYREEKEGPEIGLIELNSFGAEMASASALFHWVRDERELYSSERICIRVRTEN